VRESFHGNSVHSSSNEIYRLLQIYEIQALRSVSGGKLKLKLNYDRQSVCQSVLVSGTHLGPATNSSFSLKLRVCYFATPSLARGRVYNLLLLLVSPAQFRGTQDHIFLSEFLRLPQPGGPGQLYLYPPGTRWPRYTSGYWVPFPSPLS
jgi:hypothetical protein